MRSLSDIRLRELLPSTLMEDPTLSALANAFDDEFHLLIADIDRILLFEKFDEQPHEVLDHLAWQFGVDFYDQALPIEAKRELVGKALFWHSVKGTPFAVERVIQIAFGDGVLEEWFEYGGDPFHFRVRTLGGKFPSEEIAKTFFRMVRVVKRATAIFEKLVIDQSADQSMVIGMAIQIGKHVTIGST